MDYGSDSWEQGHSNCGSDSDSNSGVQGYSNYVPQARIGYLEVVQPEKGVSRAKEETSLSTYKQSTTNDSQSYERTSRMNRQENQSGNYERYTAKEKVSLGEPHRERGKGQVGVRDELKRSETIKIGNKSGYTEYHKVYFQMDYGSDSWEQGHSNCGSDSDSNSGVQGYSNYVPQARIGYSEVVQPEKGVSRAKEETSLSTYKQSTTNDSQSYERTSRMNRQENQSGNYERYTAKEKVSLGEPHRERGKGQVGVRDELKRSETIKIGNKSGYTEYHKEERIRDVSYDKNSSSGKNGSSKRVNYY